MSNPALDEIRQAVQTFSKSMECPWLDFQDIRCVFTDSGGRAVVGHGEAEGTGRAVTAAEAAIADLKRQLAAEEMLPPPDPLVRAASR